MFGVECMIIPSKLSSIDKAYIGYNSGPESA